MTVSEHAKALGEAIAASDEYRAYEKAKAAYEANVRIQEALMEYNAQRTILGGEFKKDLEMQDPDLVGHVKNRVDELFKQISEDPDYIAFAGAQAKVQELMNLVNEEIRFYAFGERPSCTHDCSTCHADCAGKEKETN